MRFELRHCIRGIAASPGFTLTAILILALGIGATAIVYGVIDAVLVRPLPCPTPERIVLVVETHPERGKMLVRPANYEDWRREAQWLDRSGMAFGISFVLGGERHVAGALADDGFLETWGVPPQIGRGFVSTDYQRAVVADFFGQRGDVAIISDGFWKRQFGADPQVLGRPIILDGAPYTIVGVMPPSFRVINQADVFVPWILGPNERAERRFHYFPVVARLKPAVSREQAQTELATVYRSLAADYPENAGWSAELDRPRQLLLGSTPRVLIVLMGAVSLVLLIACANIANLLLARGISRRRDFAIRLALGSSRRRLVGAQLLEAVILVLLGAVCGLTLAAVGVRLAAALPAVSQLPFAFVPSVDWRVIAFTSAVAAVCVIICTAAPAMMQSAVDLRSSFATSRGACSPSGAHLTRAVLVIAQIALGIVVVTVATLMVRSLMRLQEVDPGVRTDRVLTMQVEPSTSGQSDAGLRARLHQIIDELGLLTGVQEAALTDYLPLTEPGRTWRFSIEGRSSTPSGDEYFAVPAAVSQQFFGTLGIVKVAGRLFERTDNQASPGVVVISQAAARRYWPAAQAIGQRIRIAGIDRWFTVIGIVADAHQAKLQADPGPAIYTLWDQMPDAMRPATVLLHTEGDPLAIVPAVRNLIHTIDRTFALDDIRTMAIVRRSALDESVLRAETLSAFATLALILGAIGVYAVVAQFMGERRQELSIRVALGATNRDIVMVAAKHAGALVGIGTACGIVAAAGVARLMQGLLFGVSAADGASFGTTVLVFLAVAACATFIPARSATRIDPMAVLRME